MSEQAFVHDQEVELSSGKKVKLPPLTLRKVLTLTQSVANLITKAKEHLPPAVFSADTSGSTVAFEVAKALPILLPQVIEELSEVLSKYLGIEKDQILDEYTPEDLVAVASPFFGRIIASGTLVIEKFNVMFPTEKTTTAQKSSESESKSDSQS